MSKRVLILSTQSTHPITGGTQVRVNYLIHHLYRDLGWTVDFFCPQGMLRKESWGDNMDYLKNIYIPKAVPLPQEDSGPIFRLDHVREALQGGVLQGIVRDLKAARQRWLARRHVKDQQAKDYEILSYHRRASNDLPVHKTAKPAAPKAATAKPSSTGNPNLSPVSVRLKRYDSSHLCNSLKEIVAQNNYDAIFVTYVWMSMPIEWIFNLPKRPLMICDTIDIQYVRESRLESFRNNGGFDFQAEKKLELEYLNKYDMLLAITKVDAAEMEKELPHKDICTMMIEASVPEHLRLTEELYAKRLKEATHDLIFIGADNEANQYAVEHLLHKILPGLQKHKPDVSLSIAGRICNNPHVKAAAQNPAVELKNYVNSVDEFYRSGRVLVAPIHAGGGVKVKILEAMAHGLPVVTTPIGAEGIECKDGVHCHITHNDREFIEKTLLLLRHPNQLKRMCFEAQRNILDKLGPKVVYREFDETIERCLRKEPARTPVAT